jgi:hypothetical protein
MRPFECLVIVKSISKLIIIPKIIFLHQYSRNMVL